MRVIRPFRFVSHNQNLKIIFEALFDSLGPLLEVIVVILLIFLIFAIFGMSFLSDSLGRCQFSADPYGISRLEVTINTFISSFYLVQ